MFLDAVLRKSFTRDISLKGLPNFSSWKMLNEDRNGLSVEWLRWPLSTSQVHAFRTLEYE